MVPKEQYALNWSNHSNHLLKAFDTLLSGDEFVDVTLSCGGKKIKAHKILLSACSEYFHDLFRDNPCPHPIIILKDVDYNVLVDILKFMYCGEVQILKENFNDFIRTAEFLQVSGLTSESVDDDTCEHEDKMDSEEKPEKKERKREISDDECQSVKKYKQDLEETKEDLVEYEENSKDNEDEYVDNESANNNSDGNEDDSSHIYLNFKEIFDEGKYLHPTMNPNSECPICAKTFQKPRLLRRHFHTHLNMTRWKNCNFVLSSKCSLSRHLDSCRKLTHNINSM